MKYEEAKILTKKFYNGKTVFSHTQLKINEKNKKMVKDILVQMLEDTSGFLEKHNIRYTISNGTLLGAFREKDFIFNDDDIDIRIHKDDWNIYKENMIKSKYFNRKYITHIGENTDQIHSRIETPNEPIHLDIIPSDYEAINKLDGKYIFKKCEYIFELPTETIEINKLKVQGPNKKLIDKFLTDSFGKDYMTPKHNTYKSKEYIIGAIFILFSIISLLTFVAYKYNFKILYPIIGILSYFTIIVTINNF